MLELFFFIIINFINEVLNTKKVDRYIKEPKVHQMILFFDANGNMNCN